MRLAFLGAKRLEIELANNICLFQAKSSQQLAWDVKGAALRTFQVVLPDVLFIVGIIIIAVDILTIRDRSLTFRRPQPAA